MLPFHFCQIDPALVADVQLQRFLNQAPTELPRARRALCFTRSISSADTACSNERNPANLKPCLRAMPSISLTCATVISLPNV